MALGDNGKRSVIKGSHYRVGHVAMLGLLDPTQEQLEFPET